MSEEKSFEESLREISKKLDEIDIELAMNAEAIESVGISLMLLETELDFEAERNKNDYRA
jgi:hypothetical protein